MFTIYCNVKTITRSLCLLSIVIMFRSFGLARVSETYDFSNFAGLVWFGLFGFFTSSSTTRLYRGRAPRQSVWQFYVLPHMRQSWETMTSVSAGHIILTPTRPVGAGGHNGDRTWNLLLRSRALYQLSYRPPPPPPPQLCRYNIISQSRALHSFLF